MKISPSPHLVRSSVFTLIKVFSVVLLLSVVFFACRKSETIEPPLPKEESRQELLNRLIATYGRQGTTVNVPLNLEGKAEIVDETGTTIPRSTLLGKSSDASGAYSGPFCVTPGDIDDQGQSVTLLSVDIVYDCSEGTSFRPYFRVRTPFNLLVQSTAGSQPFSFGRFRLRNNSNTVVYTGPNASPITISAPVIDPTNPDRFEYTVSYTTAPVNNSTLSTGTRYEYRLQAYTDCDLQPVAVGVEISTSANAGSAVTPCNKLDKAYLNSYSGQYTATLNGCDAIACYSNYPSARPDGHEIQWREIGQNDQQWKYTSWPPLTGNTGFPSYVGDPAAPQPGQISSAAANGIYPYNLMNNLANSSPAPGIRRTTFPADYIEFRYRNVMWNMSQYPTIVITCYGTQWSTPVQVKVQ